MQPGEAYHCISCPVFDEHLYDEHFLEHDCTRREDVPEEQYDICPECNNTQLHEDEYTGETICLACGLILEGPYPYTAGVALEYPYGIRL